MPIHDHLKFLELTDFTPGLYEESAVSQLDMPANAFTKLNNYVPLPQGGLRAMYAISGTLAQTGIAKAACETATGVFVYPFSADRAGAATNCPDVLLTTISIDDDKVRLYRMDGSNEDTKWTCNYYSVGDKGTGVGPTSFAPTCIGVGIDGTGGELCYAIVMRGVGTDEATYSDSSGAGLYFMQYTPGCTGSNPATGDGVLTAGGLVNGASTQCTDWQGPLLINQDRIILADGYTIHFSDQDANTFGENTESGSGLVIPSSANGTSDKLVGAVAFSPADMIFIREGSPAIEVQGDISGFSAPVVIRDMATGRFGRHVQQDMIRVPDGAVFIEPGGKIFLTDGNTFAPLSDAIPPFPSLVDIGQSSETVTGITSVGRMDFLNGFLFAPHGFVLNYETKSWFKIADNTAFHYADPYSGRMWYVTAGADFEVKNMLLYQGDSGIRVSCAEVQTAPFTDSSGDDVIIREVQVGLLAYGSSTSCVCVNVVDEDGNLLVARSVGGISAGEHLIPFLFPHPRSTYLKVDIIALADNGADEAPTIEKLRIGFDKGNKIVGLK